MTQIKARKPAKKPAAKKEKPEAKQTGEVVNFADKNLHKTDRGKNVPRQFVISQEMDTELTMAAVKRGYNSRQRSQFLEEIVWAFWKANHEE